MSGSPPAVTMESTYSEANVNRSVRSPSAVGSGLRHAVMPMRGLKLERLRMGAFRKHNISAVAAGQGTRSTRGRFLKPEGRRVRMSAAAFGQEEFRSPQQKERVSRRRKTM